MIKWITLTLAILRLSIASDLFEPNRVITLRISIEPKFIQSLRDDRREYVPAVLEDGNDLNHGWTRVKGNGTAIEGTDAAQLERKSLTIDFARSESEQRFYGLRKIHLNNHYKDRTLLHEQLGGELFRSVGVPAARTSHARVILSGKDIGLFVLKEGFDPAKFSRSKDARIYEIPRWQFDFTDKSLTYIDTTSLISMIAMEVLASHTDSYSFSRNNYRVLHDGNYTLMVHGMDNLFYEALSVDPVPRGTAAEAIFRNPETKARYQRRIREIFGQQFRLEFLTNRVAELAKRIREALNPAELAEWEPALADLNTRIKKRWDYLAEQLR